MSKVQRESTIKPHCPSTLTVSYLRGAHWDATCCLSTEAILSVSQQDDSLNGNQPCFTARSDCSTTTTAVAKGSCSHVLLVGAVKRTLLRNSRLVCVMDPGGGWRRRNGR